MRKSYRASSNLELKRSCLTTSKTRNTSNAASSSRALHAMFLTSDVHLCAAASRVATHGIEVHRRRDDFLLSVFVSPEIVSMTTAICELAHLDYVASWTTRLGTPWCAPDKFSHKPAELSTLLQGLGSSTECQRSMSYPSVSRAAIQLMNSNSGTLSILIRATHFWQS